MYKSTKYIGHNRKIIKMKNNLFRVFLCKKVFFTVVNFEFLSLPLLPLLSLSPLLSSLMSISINEN